jgi:hypothetical protein
MAYQNNTLTTCPDACDDDFVLPAIAADQSCTNYAQGRSQVNRLYIIPSGALDIMADWATTPTYVSASIDNTTTDGSKAHYLVGIGELPAPEKTVLDYPDLTRRTESRLYSLSFRVLNLNAAEYDHLRKLQCGNTDFTFYYGDLADWVYGISGGLVPEMVDVDFPKGAGNEDRNVAVVTLTFRANADPERRVNPLV